MMANTSPTQPVQAKAGRRHRRPARACATHRAVIPVCLLGVPALVADAAATAPSATAQRQADARWLKLRAVLAEMEAGATMYEAARKVGVPVSSVWKWNHRFQRHGLASLMPVPKHRGSSLVERFGVTPEILRAVELLAVGLGSTVRAWREFAQSPACPDKLKFLSSAPTIPESLRAAVRFHRLDATVLVGREFAVVNLALPEPAAPVHG